MLGFMIKEFENLDDGEVELMIKAPILACILVAGADGEIDKKEIREAITFVRKNASGTLSEYFREVSQDFEDKLKILIQSYPYESTQRDPLIIQELTGLNRLWLKLDKRFSIPFYQMLKKLAEKVASSSGGILGIRTVAAAEARYMNLPMLGDPAK
jgi:hypothetical protein